MKPFDGPTCPLSMMSLNTVGHSSWCNHLLYTINHSTVNHEKGRESHCMQSTHTPCLPSIPSLLMDNPATHVIGWRSVEVQETLMMALYQKLLGASVPLPLPPQSIAPLVPAPMRSYVPLVRSMQQSALLKKSVSVPMH
jgi:hypothetical protein